MKFIVIFLVVIISSCNRVEKLDGYVLWQANLDNTVPSFIDDPIVYRDMVVQRITDGGRIVAFDKETGDELWRWTDGFDSYGVDGFSFGYYIYEDILITGWVNLTYAIDLSTGHTLWEDKATLNAIPFYTGIDEMIVKQDYNPFDLYQIRLGNASNGTFETIYEFNRDDELELSCTLPLLFEWQGVDYVTFSKHKYGVDDGIFEDYQFLHLYNLDERKLEWVSDTIPLQYSASGTAGLRPKFHDGQILLDNDAIYSYNVEDGSLEWWKYYGERFTSSRLTCAEGKVFANNNADFMVSLDVHTGFEYWRTSTANSMSLIKYHDGKLYIAGGVDREARRNLFIIDSQTGEKLVSHRLPSTDLIGSFDDIIAVDPETGWVYAGDHEHLLCFDFGLE